MMLIMIAYSQNLHESRIQGEDNNYMAPIGL